MERIALKRAGRDNRLTPGCRRVATAFALSHRFLLGGVTADNRVGHAVKADEELLLRLLHLLLRDLLGDLLLGNFLLGNFWHEK